MVKDEIRVLGIDDAPFDKSLQKDTFIIGAFFRGGHFIDGILTTKVTIDGTDSTKQLTEMITRSKFYPQLQCLMLDGIAVGGFNIVDINKLSEDTKLPVIVVVRDFPDFEKIFSALKKLKMDEKITLLEKAGIPEKIGNIFVQTAGIDKEKAAEIIKVTAIHSFVPEPIRAAHMIASGLVFGESRGKV